VTLIVGVGFQSSTLLSLFSDRGALQTTQMANDQGFVTGRYTALIIRDSPCQWQVPSSCDAIGVLVET
jgi:hypothetical protein